MECDDKITTLLYLVTRTMITRIAVRVNIVQFPLHTSRGVCSFFPLITMSVNVRYALDTQSHLNVYISDGLTDIA